MANKPLSFGEIRTKLDAFSHEFKEVTVENAEAQTFWKEFFACFGVSRIKVMHEPGSE